MVLKETLVLMLIILLVPQLVCSVNADDNLYSGNEYTCNAEYNENYMYKWSASSGSHQENDKSTFAWTAPDVDSPTEVAISVLVTDKRCGCYSNFEKIFIVIPREETKLDIETLSNSTNSTQISDSTEFALIPSNNTENSTATILMETDMKLDPASENPENVIKSLDKTLDTLSMEESRSLNSDQNETTNENAITLSLPAAEDPAEEATDQNNQAVTEENPSVMEVQKEIADSNEQRAAEETCTLSFGDGIDVNVVFDQSASLAQTTYVVIKEAVKEVIGSGTFSDGGNASTSLTNTTLMPEPGVDRSGANINQTETENSLAEIRAGSTGEADEPPEQSNVVIVGSEAAADPNPNENPPMQEINQTDIGIS